MRLLVITHAVCLLYGALWIFLWATVDKERANVWKGIQSFFWPIMIVALIVTNIKCQPIPIAKVVTHRAKDSYMWGTEANRYWRKIKLKGGKYIFKGC